MKRKKYNLGISLSGGGAKGFAHLGVLQALNEKGIFPEVIAGTSAGAFAGVFYADGYTPLEALSLFKEKSFKEFGKFSLPKGGIFSTTPFKTFLSNHLKSSTFEELKIPFYVVTTDIENGKAKVFNSGPLIDPVVASCAVPIIFNPVEIDNKFYVDGGIIKKLPATIINKKCAKIIGVNLNPFSPTKYKNTLSYVAERSFHYMSSSNILEDRKICDYLIDLRPQVLDYSMFDLKHTEDIFNIGYETTLQYLEENKERIIADFPKLKKSS